MKMCIIIKKQIVSKQGIKGPDMLVIWLTCGRTLTFLVK